MLTNADGFRFFSSSLLIAYDGQKAESDELTLKMIDFAHSTFWGFGKDKRYSGPDEGYLLGIRNLIRFLEDAVERMGCEDCKKCDFVGNISGLTSLKPTGQN